MMITSNTICISENKNLGYKHNKINQKQNFKIPYQGSLKQHSNEKISFYDGLNLFANGIENQAKDTFHSIVKHPLKTVAAMGAISLATLSLPLIGIPSVVGGGVLVTVFGALALSKTISHTINFIQNNKAQKYNQARTNIEQIGRDSVDIALSLPFVPKSVSQIKNALKFSEIGINTKLIDKINNSKTLAQKFKTLKHSDIGMLKSQNFQAAVEKELSKLKDLTDAEKLQIKKDLLEFNVKVENIPRVVINKWAEIKGIKTKPDIYYRAMNSDIYGFANANECSINLNNFKSKSKIKTFEDFELVNTKQAGNKYIITYLNKKTQKYVTEIIDKDILDSHNNLHNLYYKLTSQSRGILTVIHEREHLNQFAQMCQLRGFEWLKHGITQKGKRLYQQMIDEMPKIKYGSKQAHTIYNYTIQPTNCPPVTYIKNTMEIEAREAEYKAINHPLFNKLENVFKNVNKANKSTRPNILLNTIRLESAQN